MALSLGLQLYGSSCGVLLTDDSANYLSAAKSFRANGEFKSPDGTYFVAWPPLFPIVLSLLPHTDTALLIFQLVLKVIICLLLYLLATRFIVSEALRIAFMLATTCGVHLTMISVFLWSEPLFIILLLTNFLIAIRSEPSRFSFPLLLLSGLLLCLQRNVGILFVSGISLWLALYLQTPLKQRVLRALVFLCISVSGLLIWVNYAQSVSDEFQFSAYRFLEDPFYNAQLVFAGVGKLFITGSTWLLVVAGVASLALMSYLLRKSISRQPEVRLILIVTAVYLTGLLIPGKLDPHDVDRLLAVIVPFVYLLAFVAFDSIIPKMQLWMLRVSLIVLLLWCIYPLLRTGRNVAFWNSESCFIDFHK